MKKLQKILAVAFAAFLILGLVNCKSNLPEDEVPPAGTSTGSNSGNSGSSSGESGKKEKTISIPSSTQPTLVNPPAKVSGEDKSIPNKDMSSIFTSVTGENAEDGETIISEDNVLTITPTSKGLLIKKSHPSSWEHNTIHVKNISKGYDNFKIDNVDQNKNEMLYPFVTADNEYEIWIEKQETGWTNWGETKKTKVTAVGGSGDFALLQKGFYYDSQKHTITFKNLTLVFPDTLVNIVGDPNFEGPVFNGQPWTNTTAYYGTQYEQNNSEFTISGNNDVTKVLTSSPKVGVDLSMTVVALVTSDFAGFTYKTTVLSGVIYDSSISTDVIPLAGGVTLPKVTITPAGGYNHYNTYHFGDDWVSGNSLSIEDETYPDSFTDVSLKDRGNSTKWPAEGEGKTPFSIKFSEKSKVLGMPKSKRWVLMANYFDRSLIRTDFAGYLGNNVFNSYWNASFTPVNLYVGSKFIGTYDLGQNNKIEKNRVNIQSLEDYADSVKRAELVDVNGDGKVDIEDCGFMVEIDTATNWNNTITAENYKTKVAADWGGAERIYFYSSEKCIPMTLKDPDFGDGVKYSEDLCLEMGKYAKSKIDAFEKMLYSDDFKYEFTDYIDPVSFIDWYLINEFAKNSDANFQKSVPVTYDPKDGKLHMGPNWDFDLGFGNFDHGYDIIGGGYGTVEDPTGWYIHNGKKDCNENDLRIQMQGGPVQSYWLNRLFEAPSFKKAVKARWNDRKAFLKNAINEQIVNYGNMVKDSIDANEKILPRIGKHSWNGPSSYASRSTYEEEVTYLYDWCMARYNWMDKEISKW